MGLRIIIRTEPWSEITLNQSVEGQGTTGFVLIVIRWYYKKIYNELVNEERKFQLESSVSTSKLVFIYKKDAQIPSLAYGTWYTHITRISYTNDVPIRGYLCTCIIRARHLSAAACILPHYPRYVCYSLLFCCHQVEVRTGHGYGVDVSTSTININIEYRCNIAWCCRHIFSYWLYWYVLPGIVYLCT